HPAEYDSFVFETLENLCNRKISLTLRGRTAIMILNLIQFDQVKPLFIKGVPHVYKKSFCIDCSSDRRVDTLSDWPDNRCDRRQTANPHSYTHAWGANADSNLWCLAL